MSDWVPITPPVPIWDAQEVDGLWLGGYRSTSIACFAIACYAVACEPQSFVGWVKVYPDD